MPNYTPNYNLAQPLVNSAVDQDLWGGELNNNMSIIDTTMKSISDSVLTAGQLPIGSLYWNISNATNPSDPSLLGYGTWAAITDTFIVARGSTYTSTGGAATVSLSGGNLPSHTHTFPLGGTISAPATGVAMNATLASQNGTMTTTSTGSGSAFSIIPPYTAAYCWQRTA